MIIVHSAEYMSDILKLFISVSKMFNGQKHANTKMHLSRMAGYAQVIADIFYNALRQGTLAGLREVNLGSIYHKYLSWSSDETVKHLIGQRCEFGLEGRCANTSYDTH